MANCEVCDKKLSFLDGYSDNGNKYCDNCWKNKQGEISKINTLKWNREKKESLIIEAKEEKERVELRGIHGWLSLYALGLYFSTIFSLFWLLFYQSDLFEWPFLGIFFLLLFYPILHIYEITLMHKRRKLFVKIAIINQWFLIVLQIIAGLYVLLVYGIEAFGYLLSNYYYSWSSLIIGQIISSWIWTVYLLDSKRVRRTFIQPEQKFYTWNCEYCKKEFKTEKEAMKHENNCSKKKN